MRKIFLLLPLVFLILSCSNEGDKPKDLLPQETMVSIMADMQLAEAKVKNLHLPADSTRELYSLYELSIFEKYEVEPEQYQESFHYYLNEYNEMTAIHNALLDTLNRRQNQIAQ